MRRLNRVEYDNTVRDLLGTTRAPARERSINELGFDNDWASATKPLPPSAPPVPQRSLA